MTRELNLYESIAFANNKKELKDILNEYLDKRDILEHSLLIKYKDKRCKST